MLLKKFKFSVKLLIILLNSAVLFGTVFYFWLEKSEICLAQVNTGNEIAALNIDDATAQRGYTFTAFDGNFKLSIPPHLLSGAAQIEIIKLNESLATPWQLDLISPIYQLDLKNKSKYSTSTFWQIQLSYQDNNNYKKVYYYDQSKNIWLPLPTKDYLLNKFVRTKLPFSYARFAVFAFPDIKTVGQASWYKYKGGNFSASIDFPKGSRLRVINLENNKFIDVVINDYGPDRARHPDRILDIDKVAFTKIASLSAGTIKIAIEPLLIKPDMYGLELGLPNELKTNLSLLSKAAVIWDGKSQSLIWSKNATTTLPIASLTKMIAVRLFLDTRPTLSTIVAYSEQDEKYNYEYCQPWESAKLNIKNGETLTIADLIYASLVGSANNTIETLVRASGLNRQNFVDLMNQKASEWGASTTFFVEPTGLAPQNVSSALDYAIITQEVLINPILSKASTMSEYKFSTINSKTSHRIRNTDLLIRNNRYQLVGSKTGYLDEAGYCLMVKIKTPNNSDLIIVTLGAPDRNTSFYETEQLIKYGLHNL